LSGNVHVQQGGEVVLLHQAHYVFCRGFTLFLLLSSLYIGCNASL
jgi:hypothetical protein